MSAPYDSFRFPTGRHCPLDRAIVFDSSLTWRQALPRSVHHLCVVLHTEQVKGIARLARELRDLELSLAPARRWGPACWHVHQWWEPTLENWRSGRRALITPRRHTPGEAMKLLAHSRLRAALRGGSIEVLVPRQLSRQSGH